MEGQSDDPIFVDVSNGTEVYQGNEEEIKDNITQSRMDKVKAEAVSISDMYEVYPDCSTPGKDRFKCKLCSRYTTDDLDRMQRHIRVEQGLNPFQCTMCEYSTYNSVLFQEHVWIHEGYKPFKCSHCPYRSVSRKNTKKHEQRHRTDNPLRCRQCDYIAKHRRSLKCHTLQHHADVGDHARAKQAGTEHLCALCGMEFKLTSAFNNHKKSRRRCKFCKELLCRQNMRTHSCNKHSNAVTAEAEPKRTRKSKVMFTCAVCKWSGGYRPKILLHIIHHPDQDLSDCKVDLAVLREYGILPPASESNK